MRSNVFRAVVLLLLGAFMAPALAGEVAIYTGDVGWIDKASADTQAQICVNALTGAGIANQWYANAGEKAAVAAWVSAHTNNGALDVLVLYGYFPESIYPGGNAQPDGSIAELFIESTDGDMILNHADYMFYVSTPFNNDAGLMNMMDNSGISMWEDNTAVAVTAAGAAISPTLAASPITQSDRPFHINELQGEWYVEVALAQNLAGTRADPIIVRDGNRGRLAMAYQTPDDAALPRGAVAAEMITYLMQREAYGFSVCDHDPLTAVAGTPVRLTIQLRDRLEVPTPSATDVRVNLFSIGEMGRFDTAINGAFDGTVTSVTIPAGHVSATLFYKGVSEGFHSLRLSAEGVPALTMVGVTCFPPVAASVGTVLFYTGNVGWTDKATADAQAAICADKLTRLGISNVILSSDADKNGVAIWMSAVTNDHHRDVLVLYGYFPETIYPAGNTQPDGSIAELFIESTDGDTIINHCDYMFYVTTPCCNGDGALMNMMDTPGINMWDDWRVSVTAEGGTISPSLAQFQGAAPYYWTSRPLHTDLLAGDWFVEAALGESTTGTRADPVIVRDGNRGRIVPIFQINARNDPKGAVAAEIIAWLNGFQLGTPVKLALAGATKIMAGRALKLTVQIQDLIGTPSTRTTATTVHLATTSGGHFDISAEGSFNGSVTSVTIPAGESSAVFFYKDTNSGLPTVTASATGLEPSAREVTVVARTFAPPGEVAIFTGNVNWIDKGTADAQAQICRDSLIGVGVNATWFQNAADEAALASWVAAKTNNGQLDVLVIYGFFPGTLYAPQNAMPDGSVAELFIESPDGDAIMNHADWMFYMNDLPRLTDNGPGGLQNMMDIPTISMSGGDNPMVVTNEGRAIAPHLVNHLSDRPFHVDELAGDWIVEAALAQDAAGTRVDPCMVRDGPLGRLISCFQSDHQADPIGAVGAEIIAWLMGKTLTATELAFSGSSTTVTGTPARLTVTIQNAGGIAFPTATAKTVQLGKDSATGAFDTAFEGAYDGTVTTVTIPAGKASATVYYKDAAAGLVTLTAHTTGLADAAMAVTVLENIPVRKGEVAIYTGATSWITKAEADAEAQTCVNALTALDIPSTVFSSPAQGAALATWVTAATNNGRQDVLVLYGYLPTQIYPAGNGMPDGSIAELFIESTDGDAIINHADWMFYVSSTFNAEGGLRNMMDNLGITMTGDNTLVMVTDQGEAISSHMTDFQTDRPFHTNELAGEWFVEAALAQDASGTRADPCIVRDGNRGRLIPVYQTMNEVNPKGAVAADIIAWLMAQAATVPEGMFIRGDVNGDGIVNLTDIIVLLRWLQGIGPRPFCYDAADVDDDGLITNADAVYLRLSLFTAFPPPPPPYPNAGFDPTPDDITCEDYTPPPVIGPVEADVRFGLRAGAGLPGEEVLVPLTLRTLVPLRGMTVLLGWDPARLDFVDIVREGPETIDAVLAAEVFAPWGNPTEGWAAVEISFQTDAVFPVLTESARDNVIGHVRFVIRPDAPAPTSVVVVLPDSIVPSAEGPARLYSIAILTDGTVVNPRTISGSIAVMAPSPGGGQLIVQEVAMPVEGVEDEPLAELKAIAEYDTASGEGSITFDTGAKDFPFCFFPAQVGAVILRSIAFVHGVAMPGAAKLADCTNATSIILQVSEDYPIEDPKSKKTPFNDLGSMTVTLRMSTASPAVESIVTDFSKLDWQRLVCPAATYTYEWSNVDTKAALLTEHTGDVYVGWDSVTPNQKDFYNYRRVTVKCVPAGGTFDTTKIKDQIFTVGATYDPDTGAADFIGVVLPNDHMEFTRGDANDDGQINIGDPIHILEYLFAHKPLKSSLDAADVNDDGSVDIADAICLLSYANTQDILPMIKAPFWGMTPYLWKPGKDPTPDNL